MTLKGNYGLILLGLLSATALLSFILKPKTTIFTCTTFFDFDKQDKWKAFCRAMDSILQQHDKQTLNKINKWLIINEYSAKPKENWSAKIKEKYPFVDFIQKETYQKGQAASMNIILKEIRPYTYWIHWEETWYCRRPCLDRMFDAMDVFQPSQLQCTQHKEKPNWLDSDKHPRLLVETDKGTEMYWILPSPGTNEYMKRSAYDFSSDYIGRWPLYSLLPSINKVSHNTVGEFSTDPKLWPFKFEWDYGRRWFLAGGTKGVLPDGPVVRDNSAHKSTYSI